MGFGAVESATIVIDTPFYSSRGVNDAKHGMQHDGMNCYSPHACVT